MAVDTQKAAPQAPDTMPVRDEYKNWIKMTPEEMMLAQKNGVLIGYHPAKGLGLVKSKEGK